ncbi:alpha/beta fold hydrolase [Hellea balneolensis]|uniref:alpha/beta fold hydrolase n=1 Tax=Hellea balneolensis TaxID=287478 RepID=UPI0003F6B105|nr:alpha/beta fold hydrolase [Hellea balneolensis]
MKLINRVLKGFALLLLLGAIAFYLWPEKKYEPYQVSEAYQAQVDAFYLPDMPPDWSWKTFEAGDGTKLRWGETGNSAAAKATIVLIPGYTATMSMYPEHIDILARRGYHVVGIDMRGQGGSERHRPSQPEKLWVDDFKVYSDDLAAFVKTLPRKADQPIILIAISFGGHVGVRMAGDYPEVADGLLLLAPAIEPKAGDMPFDQAKSLMNWARRLGKSKHYLQGNENWKPFREDLSEANIDLCSSNPKRLPNRDVVFTRNPAERVGGVTAQWGAEFFESSEYIREEGYLEKIDIPVTMISAEVDHFVVTEVNQQACDARFPNCQRLDLKGAGHCLLQETDDHLGQMFDGLDKLLERVTSISN